MNANPKNSTKQTFDVEGMTCAACAVSLETMLSNTEGVNQVSVSYPNHSVTIGFNNQVDFLQLQKAANKIGYKLLKENITPW